MHFAFRFQAQLKALQYGSALLVLLFLGIVLNLPLGWAQETLRGQVEKTAEPVEDTLQGQVVDAQTSQPLANARVTIPEIGYAMMTDPQGKYQIPRYLGKNPIIMSVEKSGYAPFAMGITQFSPPVFSIKLQKQAQMIILDNKLRHLGDGSFSPGSSNAFHFQKPPDGPAIRFPFSLKGVTLSKASYLQIGSVIGLDTPMAHYLSGNPLGVTASPLVVKVNGAVIAQVDQNGDKHKIQIPQKLLKAGGNNFIEIEAGYHYPEPNRLDYDDMEWMHLVLYP